MELVCTAVRRYGNAEVIDVPAEQQELLRSAVRTSLRGDDRRLRTFVRDGTVYLTAERKDLDAERLMNVERMERIRQAFDSQLPVDPDWVIRWLAWGSRTPRQRRSPQARWPNLDRRRRKRINISRRLCPYRIRLGTLTRA